MAKSKQKHHYSGDASTSFWNRVNRLQDEPRAVIYALGCVLQDLEERVLRQLDNAERVTDGREDGPGRKR